MSRARSLHAYNSIVMQRQHLPKEGNDTLVHGTGVLAQKGGMISAFSKTRGVAGKARKTKRVLLGVCCRKLRTFTDFSGAAVKYLSSKWDGTIFRTMRSNAETCVNSRLEDYRVDGHEHRD